MAVIVAASDVPRAVELLRAQGETVYEIGRIEERKTGQPQTVIV
jgi:phosphoribosylaminoimidazole (AIR) synthetase